MEERVDLLIEYRKKVINLISKIMIVITLASGVFRLMCIPLNLFSSTPVWISMGYAVLGILEVIYMRVQVNNFNESNTAKSYANIKMMLIGSNILNLICCFVCFPALSTWSLTIFFVAALAFLQEKKLTIVSLVCNFSLTAIYLIFNFSDFMAAMNPIEELIMLGLSFLIDIVYIILNIHLITNTLANTGNMIANDSVDKLKVTLNNVNKMIPKLDQMSNGLVDITNSNNVLIESIVEASNNMLDATSQIACVVDESHKSIDHVSENANQVAISIEGVCGQYNHIVDTITNSAMVLEEIQKSGHDVITSTTEVLDVTEKLEFSIGQINNIAIAIKNISDETKILALNALIEASRAGEVGKGFSVVANRVQEMAQSTADTVKGMDNIIENIHNAMYTVKEKVEVSVDEVEKQNKSISNIVGDIESVTFKIKGALDELLKVNDISNQHKQYAVGLVEKNNTILSCVDAQEDKAKLVAQYAVKNKEDINKLLECAREIDEAVKLLAVTSNQN